MAFTGRHGQLVVDRAKHKDFLPRISRRSRPHTPFAQVEAWLNQLEAQMVLGLYGETRASFVESAGVGTAESALARFGVAS